MQEMAACTHIIAMIVGPLSTSPPAGASIVVLGILYFVYAECWKEDANPSLRPDQSSKQVNDYNARKSEPIYEIGQHD